MEPGPEMDLAVARAVGLPCMGFNELGRWSDVGRAADNGCVYTGPSPVSSRPFNPSGSAHDAVRALEAVGTFTVQSAAPIPGTGRRYSVSIYVEEWSVDGACADSEVVRSGDALPEAACRAILAWAEAKETAQ